MIDLNQVCIHAGRFSIRDVSFSVAAGEYAVLMGKTGSGKTTILEAVCGLRGVDSGRIVLRDRDVTKLSPAERGLGYVPQDLALFPTMTVARHLEFALRIRRRPPNVVAARVRELASLLGIESILDRFPQGLSGGESQRVALGRALSFHPAVLLLDEPLSALDEESRGEIVALLKQVQQKTRVTVLHVTHSRSEAEALADRRFLVRNGQVTEER